MRESGLQCPKAKFRASCRPTQSWQKPCCQRPNSELGFLNAGIEARKRPEGTLESATYDRKAAAPLVSARSSRTLRPHDTLVRASLLRSGGPHCCVCAGRIVAFAQAALLRVQAGRIAELARTALPSSCGPHCRVRAGRIAAPRRTSLPSSCGPYCCAQAGRIAEFMRALLLPSCSFFRFHATISAQSTTFARAMLE